MFDVTIKDIPANEEILFAKKVDFRDHSFVGIPSNKTVKFVITNLAVYVKIANVLIDWSGTSRVRIDEIISLTVKEPTLFKYCRYLTITDPFGKSTIIPFVKDCETIIMILTKINPNITLINE